VFALLPTVVNVGVEKPVAGLASHGGREERGSV
jgi:hypothetical protein